MRSLKKSHCPEKKNNISNYSHIPFLYFLGFLETINGTLRSQKKFSKEMFTQFFWHQQISSTSLGTYFFSLQTSDLPEIYSHTKAKPMINLVSNRRLLRLRRPNYSSELSFSKYYERAKLNIRGKKKPWEQEGIYSGFSSIYEHWWKQRSDSHCISV